MDRLASITAFVRVAENGGFSAAARSIDVSTTTVSDQVQALENALGVRLLNRTTRRVSRILSLGYVAARYSHGRFLETRYTLMRPIYVLRWL